MNFLFTDDLGGVPAIEFRTIGGDSWMALNAPSITIPAEAMDYRTQKRMSIAIQDLQGSSWRWNGHSIWIGMIVTRAGDHLSP